MRRATESEGLAPARLWIDEVGEGLGFASLRAEWSRLVFKSEASPFLTWEWLYPWWRRVAPEAGLRILTARDERGGLAGLLPLCERRSQVAGLEVRRWGFLGCDDWVGSEYLDAVAPRGREGQLASLFAEHLAARRARFDVLELLDLPEGSALGARVLELLAPGALLAERFARHVCPIVETRGDFESYLREVGRADNLARRRKWLVAQPGFAIERTEQPGEVAAAMADFFRLHRLRWERDGGSQGINTAEVRAFHRDAAELLAESGMLRLYTLRLGSQALASVYGIVHRDRFYYYQSGYDPGWTRRSVGLVLLGETLADAFREKRADFDFLRGQEPYKFEWAKKARRRTEGVRIVNRTAAGAAWLAATSGARAVKSAARRLIGDERWEELRRRKRRRGSS